MMWSSTGCCSAAATAAAPTEDSSSSCMDIRQQASAYPMQRRSSAAQTHPFLPMAHRQLHIADFKAQAYLRAMLHVHRRRWQKRKRRLLLPCSHNCRMPSFDSAQLTWFDACSNIPAHPRELGSKALPIDAWQVDACVVASVAHPAGSRGGRQSSAGSASGRGSAAAEPPAHKLTKP